MINSLYFNPIILYNNNYCLDQEAILKNNRVYVDYVVDFYTKILD